MRASDEFGCKKCGYIKPRFMMFNQNICNACREELKNETEKSSQ